MSPTPSDRPMRERILAAAVTVIRERGVTGATTREIARVAGVSEGSLYNHFENKTALFGAAFGAVAGGIRDALRDLVGRVGTGTVEENLTRLATAAIAFYGDLLPMTGPVMADRGVREWLRGTGPGQPGAVGPVQGHAPLVAYLRAEQQAGRLAPHSRPEFVAACLLGACQQFAFLSLFTEPAVLAERAGLPADAEEYARGVVRTVLTAQLA